MRIPSAALRLGVEQEHFIFLENGSVPSLAQMSDVFRDLAAAGYRPRKITNDGNILSVNRDVGTGYSSIKNDFCTHVLEAALSPCVSASELEELYIETWHHLAIALRNHGISIRSGAALNESQQDLILVPHPRRSWMEQRAVPSPRPPMWDTFFTTLICATQIHMNLLDDNFYQSLPALYAFEVLTPLLFSNSKGLLGQAAYCARPLAWRDNFALDYVVFGFPARVPKSRSEYVQMLASSRGFSRDYCFLAPRDHGTVEFRSADAQDSIADILELIGLKLASVTAAKVLSKIEFSALDSDSNLFYHVCEHGILPKTFLQKCHSHFASAESAIPEEWRLPFIGFMNRLESKIESIN